MIRSARMEDANALAQLAGELGYPSTSAEILERMQSLSSNDEVLVFDDGGVAGWIHLAVVPSIESERFAQINGLVVCETRRGSGIGAELVRAAEAWARERNVKRLRVRTNVTRTQTHVFYERCGFMHKKTTRVYDKTL